MSLDLNMGYYHIRIRKNASKLCAIILLWGKYWYKRLPMGVANSPDILQQIMNYLFYGFEFICAYIDDLFILEKIDWTDHAARVLENHYAIIAMIA